MKIKTLMLAALGTAFIMNSCSKSTIDIHFDSYTDGDNSSGNNSSRTLVTFNAAIEGRNMTRAMSPMGKGVENQLYAFDAAKNISSAAIAEGTYVTFAPGLLSGVDGYKMYLSNGIYNFYAVSTNTPDAPPTFTAGKSELLKNGIDYLWWKGSQQDVNSSQIMIPIVYLHVATQVVIEVSSGVGLELEKLVSATITPTETGQSMYLNTGEIPAGYGYGAAVPMGINGFLAQYIMLPLQSDSPLKLTFEVLVKGESLTRNYETEVPIPGGELKAGDSYLFSAVINENRVSFPVVSVKAWTDVDETGKPLYPKQ